MNIIGNVKNKTCIIVDDIIDSEHYNQCCRHIKKKKTKEVFVFITHAVLREAAKIKNSK